MGSKNDQQSPSATVKDTAKVAVKRRRPERVQKSVARETEKKTVQKATARASKSVSKAMEKSIGVAVSDEVKVSDASVRTAIATRFAERDGASGLDFLTQCFIVQQLACFCRVPEVRAAVKEIFDLDVPEWGHRRKRNKLHVKVFCQGAVK